MEHSYASVVKRNLKENTSNQLVIEKSPPTVENERLFVDDKSESNVEKLESNVVKPESNVEKHESNVVKLESNVVKLESKVDTPSIKIKIIDNSTKSSKNNSYKKRTNFSNNNNRNNKRNNNRKPSPKHSAMLKAQKEMIKECLPSQELSAEIVTSLQYLVDWRGTSIQLKIDSDELVVNYEDKDYTFQKSKFLQNKFFWRDLNRVYQNKFGYDIRVRVNKPKFEDGDYYIKIMRNYY